MSGEKTSSPPSRKQHGAFDKETGAILRDFVKFGEDGAATGAADDEKKKRKRRKPRAYGRTGALDDHPLLHPQITLIIGRTGSGKTQLAVNLLDEICQTVNPDKMGKIYFYSGSPSDPALRVLNEDVVNIYGPDNTQQLLDDLRKHASDCAKIMQESTEGGSDASTEVKSTSSDEEKKGQEKDTISKSICTAAVKDAVDCQDQNGRKRGRRKKHPRTETSLPLSILILDDASNSAVLSPTQKGSEIGDIFVAVRHLGLHLIVLSQRYNMLNIFLRSNASNIFLFPGCRPEEQKQIFSDSGMPLDLLQRQMRICSAEPHQFMYINAMKKSVMLGFNRNVMK